MEICDDGSVVVVALEDCGEGAQSYVRWRLSTALAALAPTRDAYVRRVAGAAAARVIERHGVVRVCVDAETRDVVLGVVAAYEQTIATMVVRTRYRGLGVGDALAGAVGARWSLRELRDVSDTVRERVREIGGADSLWRWCEVSDVD